MALTTLLLLLPACHFTHVWHIASEQFNSINDYSPVWVSYRVSSCPLFVFVLVLSIAVCPAITASILTAAILHSHHGTQPPFCIVLLQVHVHNS